MDARKVLVSGFFVSLAAVLRAGETAENRLEEAFFREVALADAEGAIAEYRAILADPSAPPRALAIAHLRLGICLARRGEDEEARRHLQAAIEKHSLDEEAAATARELLGRETRPDPARYFPPDVLAYVEVVDPSAHTGRLASLVEGTPLQNPVDTYVSRLARREADAGSAEPFPAADSPPAAAFFNEGFLSEIAKIGGLAVAVPGGRKDGREFIGVFFPGRSDILRGLVQMLLALSRAEGVGRVGENALLRARPEGETVPEDPDEWVHVSLGPKAVVFGSPRRLVEEAVLREAGGADSLAGDPDFLRARAARAGSFLFSYIHRGRALEAVAKGLRPEERPAFEALRAALALDALDSVSVTAAYEATADAVKLTARARLGPDAAGGLGALRTRPLRPDLLRAVPEDCAAFFACTLGDETSRRAAARVLGGLADARARSRGGPLWAFLRSPEALDVYLSLESLVVGADVQPPLPPLLSAFAIVEFAEPGRGAERIEAFLSGLSGALFRNAASERFETEELDLGGTKFLARAIEPVPGLRARYVRLGDLFAIAFLPRQLEAMASARARGGPRNIPPRAEKALGIFPAKLAGSLTAADPAVRAVLSEVREVFVVTREAKDSLSVEVVVPSATPTFRAILSKIAEIAPRR